MEWVDLLINGICLGGLYGVLGVGLALVTGVMRIINVAHGEFIVLAAFMGLGLSTALPGVDPLILMIPVAIVFFFVGWGVQAVLLNRVTGTPDVLVPILLTFGFSIVLRNLMAAIFGADVHSITSGALARLRVEAFGLSVGVLPLVTLAIAVFFFVALQLVISYTRFGRVVRATADNPEVARLMGVNPRRIYNIVMGFALALAAIAGMLLAMRGTFTPFSGISNLLVAFEVIVLGGFGSFWGALIGGLALGIAELVGLKLAPNSGLIAVHLVFFAVVLLKPNGLFGVAVP